MRVTTIAALLLALGCTGSSKEPEQPKPEPEPVAETPEKKLYKAQLSACAAVCERLTECAVADARKNLSPEKLAELDLNRTAPEHTRRCSESCDKKQLSPRQIVVMRECVNGPAECPAYLDCLDRAKPSSGS